MTENWDHRAICWGAFSFLRTLQKSELTSCLLPIAVFEVSGQRAQSQACKCTEGLVPDDAGWSSIFWNSAWDPAPRCARQVQRQGLYYRSKCPARIG
jgi:hypothetical protein